MPSPSEVSLRKTRGVCITCGTKKPVKGRVTCQKCLDRIHQHRNVSPRGKQYKQNWSFVKAYGLTAEDRKGMYVKQGGSCASCERPMDLDELHTDHKKGTKFVRGLLCPPCNKALGMLQEQPQRIHRLGEYIARADERFKMKYIVQHTHPNPKKGRDEPLFLIVDCSKENCAECARRPNAKPNTPRITRTPQQPRHKSSRANGRQKP